MVFAAIAAGGIGSRMGRGNLPKQFLKISEKPILIHTLEKFVENKNIDKTVVLCPNEWIRHTEDLLKEHLPSADVSVIEGGASRTDTIYNAVKFISDNFNIGEEDIIITHDAVRPFVTQRIINENIKTAKEYGACGTAIPATDTLFESENGAIITKMPDRAVMYQQQTPQTFRVKKLKELCENLADYEKKSLTDACKIYILKGEEVRFIKGETFNIKITYPQDIAFAESLLKGEMK